MAHRGRPLERLALWGIRKLREQSSEVVVLHTRDLRYVLGRTDPSSPQPCVQPLITHYRLVSTSDDESQAALSVWSGPIWVPHSEGNLSPTENGPSRDSHCGESAKYGRTTTVLSD
jgi:hypothetical protein